jgi:hypothetical protein
LGFAAVGPDCRELPEWPSCQILYVFSYTLTKTHN